MGILKHVYNKREEWKKLVLIAKGLDDLKSKKQKKNKEKSIKYKTIFI